MADAVLRIFGAIARWHHQRYEDYRPPLTKGMWRVAERRRKRILTDAELKAIWNCDGGPYGALVKLAVLTAQRRDKLRTLRWEDIKDGVWTIRTEPREKGNPGQLRLPKLALDIIEGQPRLAGNPCIFPGRGEGPIASSGNYKAEFDKLCGVKDWRIHDLRRTARSLMARAGVISEHAEHESWGTRLPGSKAFTTGIVIKTNAAASQKLAALIERRTNGRTYHVLVPIGAIYVEGHPSARRIIRVY